MTKSNTIVKMTRPNKEDYKVFDAITGLCEFLSTTYINQLEKYIDYLESQGDCCSHYEKKIQELEEALETKCDSCSLDFEYRLRREDI